MFSAKKNSLTNKFIPIQSLADSRYISRKLFQIQQVYLERGDQRHIPLAGNVPLVFFRLNRFFVAHPGSVLGGNKIRTGGF